MRTTFLQFLRDETLRTELGPDVLADLAVENLELSTPARTEAVRRTIIERRAGVDLVAGPVAVTPAAA
jgi:hypothetical protein